MDHCIDLKAIRDAAGRIGDRAHRTPIATCSTLDDRTGARLFFKCEHLQRGGAFKIRGATNAILQLPDPVRDVVTHSSGNHAQAVALAARASGRTAHIVMPSNTTPAKIAAVRDYGARVTECEPTLAAREENAARLLEETGGALIHPYDHPHTIAGQGTAGLELLDQVDDLDVVMAPVGGGGLMSGLAVATRALRPGARVVGAEPAGADDAARSRDAGHFIPQTDSRTVADGLRTSLGEHTTWPILRDLLDDLVVVEEAEIVAAMRLLWERAKLPVEPSSAVPLAVLLRRPPWAAGKRVGVILSGGNANLDALPW